MNTFKKNPNWLPNKILKHSFGWEREETSSTDLIVQKDEREQGVRGCGGTTTIYDHAEQRDH